VPHTVQNAPSLPAVRNLLLVALPARDLAHLRQQLELVTLNVGATLHLAGEPIGDAYFVETGYVSVVARLSGSDVAEVGRIGREGMFGIPLALAADTDPNEAMVQASGTALRISADWFLLEIGRGAPSCFATLLHSMPRVHRRRSATAATPSSTVSRAGC
jgi:CRP-like cAMP-binding protein